MQRSNRSVYLEVRVRSEAKPNLLKVGMIEHGEHSQSKEAQLVGALAGALAEVLCEEYSDTIEPSAVARTAISAYQEMVAENPVLAHGEELPLDASPAQVRMARN